MVAAVIAVVLAVAGVLPGDDSTAPSSTAAVRMPAEVGSYARLSDIALSTSAKQTTAAANTKQNQATAAALAAAHVGLICPVT